MFTREQARLLAEKILSYSKFPECTVRASAREDAYIRFANNAVTTSGFTSKRTISILSTRDGRTGVVQTTDTADDRLRGAVKRSEEMAAIAPPNPEHVPPLGPQDYPAIDAFDEQTVRARGPEMVPQIRAILEAAGKARLVAAGFFGRSASIEVLANKNGLFGYHRAADSQLGATMRTADGSSSSWAGRPSVRITEINGAELAGRAIEKCLKWRKPIRLDPGRYTVVLEPTAASDLLSLMDDAFRARDAEEGRSFLSKPGGGTRLGEKLFPEFITLRSDPFDQRLPGAPWTREGVANRPVAWIEKGVVRNLEYDRYWAAKAGRAPAPYPGNLLLEGGEAGLDELIGSVDRGLLVTRFWYIRTVNPQTLQHTGLTRDGVFLIEGGKVTTPVMNFRFNESPVRLLQNARKLGRPVRARGREGVGMVAPALVAADFNFTSISDAV